jgi:hypothetical protein
LERGALPSGPLGFVFAPLEPASRAGNSRDATKAAIVAGLARFAREQERRARDVAVAVAA